MQKYSVRVYNNGSINWFNEKGYLHREGGPAVEYPDGYKSWWINGKEVTEQEVMGHTIVIDGKEIKISAESYKNLKESL